LPRLKESRTDNAHPCPRVGKTGAGLFSPQQNVEPQQKALSLRPKGKTPMRLHAPPVVRRTLACCLPVADGACRSGDDHPHRNSDIGNRRNRRIRFSQKTPVWPDSPLRSRSHSTIQREPITASQSYIVSTSNSNPGTAVLQIGNGSFGFGTFSYSPYQSAARLTADGDVGFTTPICHINACRFIRVIWLQFYFAISRQQPSYSLPCAGSRPQPENPSGCSQCRSRSRP